MSEDQIIEVTELQENEDGSAIVEIKTSPDVTAMLVGLGLQVVIQRAMLEELEEANTCAKNC